jgi:Ribonuclease G/E
VSGRRLYLDTAAGERRGVITLDGRPERLLIERHGDLAPQQPGSRSVARVRSIESALGSAFVDLGQGPDGLLALSGAKGLTTGAWIEVEVVSPPRRGKGAALRLLGSAAGGPQQLLAAAPTLQAKLKAAAPDAPVVEGDGARDMADLAEEVALAVEHPLPGGGRLFIEPTQALTAIDVDVGAAVGDARRAAVRANLEALQTAARLLRLKSLGGLVAIDLAGKGHDGARLSAAAKAAFAPDGAEVSIGPISRFGVMELALPRKEAPIMEMLLDADGRPSVETAVHRLFRAIERAAGPGVRVEARAAPEIAAAAAPLAVLLAERIGRRFVITASAEPGPRAFDVRPL